MTVVGVHLVQIIKIVIKIHKLAKIVHLLLNSEVSLQINLNCYNQTILK